ncbi:hypothetical protein [Shimia sp.]|uniref:hypothetical protein n=1 Tax=unclassified Shimia TaxID=2630038 RepID=UPI003445BA75
MFAEDRRLFDYRRLHMMVERQGWQTNPKKLRRLYREAAPASGNGGNLPGASSNLSAGIGSSRPLRHLGGGSTRAD